MTSRGAADVRASASGRFSKMLMTESIVPELSVRHDAETRVGAKASHHAFARNSLRALVVGLLLLTVGGCTQITALGNLFGDHDVQAPDEPADKLYNEGLFLLNEKGNSRDALKRFEEVDRQHPYSEWARKSLLMSAFASYQAKDYDEAISTSKRYLALHPGTPEAAYAQYLIGSSYYDRIPDVTRDQGRTEKALNELDEVVRKYPDTEYAASARKKMEVARDQLAGKEMTIGRYYLERHDYTGAINRFKVVVTRYQRTRHVEEALERLTEAYMALGIVAEAQTAAAVLGHNFPNSPWYKDAYNLVTKGGAEPTENKGSWISRAFKGVGLG
jgi:outer membrane protein assembly factor BamD